VRIARDGECLQPAQRAAKIGFDLIPLLEKMSEDLVSITAYNRESNRRVRVKPVELIAELEAHELKINEVALPSVPDREAGAAIRLR
jgi:hypothetical protein